MLGLVTVSGETKKAGLERRRLGGVSFLVLTLPERAVGNGLRRRRGAGRWGEMLRKEGVRQCVFPEGFAQTALFVRRGVCPVDTLALERALAGRYTKQRLEAAAVEPGRAVVAVSGERLTRTLADTVRMMVREYRYVLLDVPEGGDTLAWELRRERGASLLLGGRREMLEEADALVLFGPRGDLKGGQQVRLELYPGGECRVPLGVPEELREQFPAELCREQLAAALWQAGDGKAARFMGEIHC